MSLALDILLLYMISPDSQYVLHAFPCNSSMVILPISSLRNVSSSGRATISPHLCIFLCHRAPQTVLSPPFWLSHVRRLVALLIQLRCSFSEFCLIYSMFNVKLYMSRKERHHQIPSNSVHQAAQLYPVTRHEEKNPLCFVMLNKTL